MKLTHKQKVRKARQMLSQYEKSTYYFDKESNTWYRKPRTALFQSKRWNLMSQAKADKRHTQWQYSKKKMTATV